MRVLLVLTIVLMGFGNLALADTLQEYTVKAIRSLNFARFTQWSVSALNTSERTVSVCVLGNKIAQEAFAHIDRKTIGDKAIKILHPNQLKNFRQCQIIYLSQLDPQTSLEILSKIGYMAVLTIGEDKDFLKNGGMIQLEMADGKINMNINLVAVRRAGLEISSRALKLAKIVEY